MVHCISEDCRKEIEDAWSFCPFCGKDNRPPQDRPQISDCEHEFIDSKGYCVRCGQEFPKPKTIPRIWGQPADPASDAPNINYDWQGGCLLTEGWGLGCLILVWIVIFGFMIVAYINFRSH